MKPRGTLTVLIVGVLLIFFIVLFLRSGLFSKQNKSLETDKKITISASFYPLANLATQIGGKNVQVINITPLGVEPHDYEPTPQDIVKIESSQIILLNGGGLDPWGDRFDPTLKQKGTYIIKMSDLIMSIEAPDPHFWLDPVLYARMAEIVRDALVKVDTNSKIYYQNNYEIYKTKLETLNKDYENGLKSCQLDEIIVSHNAFSYLARHYHFTTLYITGFSPDEEPSPKKIAEIATLARKKNIKYIFFETLVSPKIADIIAYEIGAQTLVLNPLEGLTENEIKSGINYISAMEANLTNLQKAMVCR